MTRWLLLLSAWVVSAACLACSGPAQPVPEPTPEPPSPKSCDVVLTSDADAVVGEFTSWSEVALVDGELVLPDLAPGVYAYAWVRAGAREPTPTDDFTKWVDGTEYRALRVADCRVASWEVAPPEMLGGELTATLRFVPAAGGAALDVSSITATAGDVAMDVTPTDDGVTLTAMLPTYGKYTLTVHAQDADGVDVEPLWVPLWHEATPFTWQDALLYLVFTDRFRDTDGAGADPLDDVAPIASYQGGDFDGVRQAIEEGYFDALGVNALWLSPTYENPDGGFLGADGTTRYAGFHGYWPVDPLRAESRFGGDAALHALIAAAHARGIRVLFDVVLNHVHEDHPYCDQPTWCSTTCVCGTPGCGYDEKPIECQFAPYLPDLDYRNADLLEAVVEDVLALTRKFDVDGLRIDAAKHMEHVIMRTLRLRTQQLEAQHAAPFYLVGETFTFDRGEIMRYVNDSELHGQFDFPLFGAIRGTFAHDNSFRDLEAAVAASQRDYGRYYAWMSPFLGNHDVERFATLLAGNDAGPFGDSADLMAQGTSEVEQWAMINRMSMAFAFLLTQPGVPLIYYGDEVGLAGSGDPDNRRLMPQALNANRLELLQRVQQLGQLRRDIDALRHGGRKELWINDDFYVYVRDRAPGDVAIVAMNKGATHTAQVQLPNALGLAGATFTSRNSARSFRAIDGVLSITLDPWEYVVMTPE